MSSFHPGESIQDGVTKIFSYIPQVIAAVLLLIVGYIIAKVLQNITRKLLRRLRFDRALHTSPAGNYISRVVESPTNFAGKSVFWILYLAFISFAISALNLPLLNQIVGGIYSYVPRIIAALIIFLVASAVSVSGVAFVSRVMGRTPMAKLIGTVIPSITMSIAVFMILNELNIATDIVNITYTAIMGSLALGLALAFGLGGRDVAKQMLEQAYESGRRNSGSVKAELNRAKETAKAQASQARDKIQN